MSIFTESFLMIERPSGLFTFTEMILDEINKSRCLVFKIDAHDPDEDGCADFLWGKLTPHLSLSEGDYMKISEEGGTYCAEFGTRGCCGGDPTFGGYSFLDPTPENAVMVSKEYIDYFSRFH